MIVCISKTLQQLYSFIVPKRFMAKKEVFEWIRTEQKNIELRAGIKRKIKQSPLRFPSRTEG